MSHQAKVNIFTVKWGDKFNAHHVNRLYRMVKKNLTIPFNFYCNTDNWQSLDSGINVIPLTNNLFMYNKIRMLSLHYEGLVGKTIYFDLDVVIQNNINDLFDLECDGLRAIRARWKHPIYSPVHILVNNQYKDTMLNGSVLMWNPNDWDAHFIWLHFNKDKHHWKQKYLGTTDYFWFHEKLPVCYWPKKLIYSRIQGHNWKEWYKGQEVVDGINCYRMPEYKVCVFNNVEPDSPLYRGYEHYWE